MNAEELGRWLREEHERTESLSERLRETVAQTPSASDAKWIECLRECFDHLRAHLTKHMALEERNGYLAPVVERRPALSAKVERLHTEHGQIQRIMNEIHDSLHAMRAADSLLIRDIRIRIDALLTHVAQHHNAENMIMLQVFTTDIGGED